MPWRKAIPDLSRQHNLGNIRQHVDQQANGKNDDPVPESVQCCKCGGIEKPEKDHIRVQRIDQKTRQRDLGEICSAEVAHLFRCSGPDVNLFKKDIEDAHRTKEGCANIADRLPELQYLADPLGKKDGNPACTLRI